jgi:hypothetical protein
MRPNSVVEQAAGFEVVNERGRGAVDLVGHVGELGLDVGVVVPVFRGAAGTAPELHEADAALDHPPGDDAPAGEVGGDGVVEAVELPGRVSLAGEVEQLGGVDLELGGELVGFDAGFEAGVAGVFR